MDFITALSKLLTSKALRDHYVKAPEAVADKLSIDTDEREYFLNIDIYQLEQQAKTLLSKRFHEVKNKIPETIFQLDDLSYGYFMEYSEHFWPDGNHRHTLDAIAFVEYLKKIEVKICKYEYNRILFNMKRKKMSVHFLSKIKIRGEFYRAIQVIFKISSKRHEWCLYIK